MYDNIKSTDMGLVNANISSGMQEEIFLSEREIIKTMVRGRTVPYFQEVRESVLQIPLNFAFLEPWNEEKIREVARWLSQNYYKELYFSDNINRKFYCIYTGDTKLIHNTLKQGYISLTMENIDAYTYTPIYTSIFDFSINPASGTELLIQNIGDVDCLPIVEVYIVNGSSFSIMNMSDSGDSMSFAGLSINEKLTINCESEDITSDIPMTYRYDSHNGLFLKLTRGNNYLKVFGNVELRFTYQFKTKQG
jgi:phage-related protein